MSASFAFPSLRRLNAAALAAAVLFAIAAVVAVASETVRVIVTSSSDRSAGAAVERVGGRVATAYPYEVGATDVWAGTAWLWG